MQANEVGRDSDLSAPQFQNVRKMGKTFESLFYVQFEVGEQMLVPLPPDFQSCSKIGKLLAGNSDFVTLIFRLALSAR